MAQIETNNTKSTKIQGRSLKLEEFDAQCQELKRILVTVGYDANRDLWARSFQIWGERIADLREGKVELISNQTQFKF